MNLFNQAGGLQFEKCISSPCLTIFVISTGA